MVRGGAGSRDGESGVRHSTTRALNSFTERGGLVSGKSGPQRETSSAIREPCSLESMEDASRKILDTFEEVMFR